MKTFVIASALAISAPGVAVAQQGTLAPQSAPRTAPVNGVLTIYGNDPCPADTICVTAPESERFRIPKNLRETQITPDRQSWAVRQEQVLNAGQTGIGSCSQSGIGSATGCTLGRVNDWAAARAAERAAAPDLDDQ